MEYGEHKIGSLKLVFLEGLSEEPLSYRLRPIPRYVLCIPINLPLTKMT